MHSTTSCRKEESVIPNAASNASYRTDVWHAIVHSVMEAAPVPFERRVGFPAKAGNKSHLQAHKPGGKD